MTVTYETDDMKAERPVMATLEVDVDGDLRLKLNGATVAYLDEDGVMRMWGLTSTEVEKLNQAGIPTVETDQGVFIKVDK